MFVIRRSLLVCALLVLAGFLLPGRAGAQDAPNVVLIVTDDQRWDTLAYMPTVSSELVGKGVRFANAFVVNPLCCPSRATILTGTYSHTSGVWSNAGNRHGGIHVFDPSATLATWLDEEGYETMLIGKYIHGYGPPVGSPFVPTGWDRWLAFFGSPGYFKYKLTDGTSLRQYGESGPVEAEYSTDVLAAEADTFIRSATSPFFLYFAPFAPHQEGRLTVEPAPRHVDAFAGVPYAPPPSVNEDDVSDKPRFIRRRPGYPVEGLTELREEQLEALLALDEAVARMLRALRATGRMRDTLFLLTSDNGQAWGEHRWVGKRLAYDEPIRVPLVARWDALGLAPRDEKRFALNVDLASTVTAAAGVEVPGRDGRSLLPLLPGGPVAWRSRFLIEYHDPPFFPSYCGIRSQRWKYVQYRTGEEELYNLRRDPYELTDLAGEPRHRARVMVGRTRVRRSSCRPPNAYSPLRLCSRIGTSHGETIRGTRWRDWICAGGGNDVIRVGGGGHDVVRCGPGRDIVRAGLADRAHGCERIIQR